MKTRLFAAASIILVMLVTGTAVYSYAEGWTLVDSFYFTAITLLTIGYGELVPTLDATKLFTVFFAFVGVGTILYCLTVVAQYVVVKRVEKVERKISSLRPHIHKKKKT